jgi:methylmalonyl-CoA/ethylmalonyl-CoA epimerase
LPVRRNRARGGQIESSTARVQGGVRIRGDGPEVERELFHHAQTASLARLENMFRTACQVCYSRQAYLEAVNVGQTSWADNPRPPLRRKSRGMTPLNELAFHHLGIACASIEQERQTWMLLGYRDEGLPFVDELQGIRGQFMVGSGPRVELLEGTPGSVTLAPWLKRRIKIYHTGYLVANFDGAIQHLASKGAVLVRDPVMSVYFNTRIAFLVMPNMMLVELIDGNRAGLPEQGLSF